MRYKERQSAVYRTQGFIMQSGQKSENKVSYVTVQFTVTQLGGFGGGYYFFTFLGLKVFN